MSAFKTNIYVTGATLRSGRTVFPDTVTTAELFGILREDYKDELGSDVDGKLYEISGVTAEQAERENSVEANAKILACIRNEL